MTLLNGHEKELLDKSTIPANHVLRRKQELVTITFRSGRQGIPTAVGALRSGLDVVQVSMLSLSTHDAPYCRTLKALKVLRHVKSSLSFVYHLFILRCRGFERAVRVWII